MEITAAGIEAETVIPTLSPRYALAPARTTESNTPRTIALPVISGRMVEAGMKGRSTAEEVDGRSGGTAADS